MKAKGAVVKLGLINIMLTVVCISAISALFIWRERAIMGALDGILLCGRIVIPALFPFMFFADFIGRSGVSKVLGIVITPLFRLLFGVGGRSATAVLLSFFSGYPVSARLITQLHKNGDIGRKEAERLMRFCVNPGPAFCISAVGAGLLGSVRAGVIILASVMLSSVLVGVLSRKCVENEIYNSNVPVKTKSVSQVFCDSCSFSASATISICAYTILFSVFMGIVGGFSVINSFIKPLLPLVEITTGISKLGRFPLPLFAAYVSFGGLSVQLQLLFFAKDAGISFKNIFLWRSICAVLSLVVCGVLLVFFPVVLPDAPVISATLASGRGNLFSSFCLLFSVLVFLAYLRQIFRQKNQII